MVPQPRRAVGRQVPQDTYGDQVADPVDHGFNYEKQFRRDVRQQAIRTAEGLVHSSINNDPTKKKSASDLARELVDAAEIIENGLLHNTPDDQRGRVVANAQNASLDNINATMEEPFHGGYRSPPEGW